MSPIDLRGDKAGSSRTASGRRRIRALMPGDTKTPLARDAARRHGRGLVFSPEAADGELSGIWDTSGIPEAAVLPSRAIWCRAGDRRRGRSRVQTQVARHQEKKSRKKRRALPQPPRNAERPCRNLLLFSNIPPLVDTLFPRGGTETQWYASPSSRLLHVPHPPTQGVHGMFSEARNEKRQN